MPLVLALLSFDCCFVCLLVCVSDDYIHGHVCMWHAHITCRYGHRPVVLDAAYKPAVTKLIAQAQAAKCPYILGAQMLVEQGLCQFELWTKKHAPKQSMRKVQPLFFLFVNGRHSDAEF